MSTEPSSVSVPPATTATVESNPARPLDTRASSPDLPPTIRRLRAVRALLWALVGVMTIVWLFYGGGMHSIASLIRVTPKPVATADIGQPAPALKLPLAGGGEMDLASFRGRPVVVNFWATWCEPCRAEMPVFERAHTQYADQGLVIVGVDMQEQDADIQAFMAQVGVTFPSMVDRTGEVTRQWRATGLPTTFLIDRQGIIRDVRVGPFTDEMLAERIAKLLAQ